MISFKTYITNTNEELLYVGTPDLSMLNALAEGPGDVWHSSLDQGFTNAFQDLQYQTAVFWWYLNDFPVNTTAVSWRINATMFVVRKKVWEHMGGFDEHYESTLFQGLDFGYNLLRHIGGIPLYVKNLFPASHTDIVISAFDRYLFFRKYFKIYHSYYMMYRKGLSSFGKELSAFIKASKGKTNQKCTDRLPPRILKNITNTPTVSIVIPTMNRQKQTVVLLEDYNVQTYVPTEVIVVDATPVEKRNEDLYDTDKYSFELRVIWQQSKGSCRARNEAMNACKGDYIIFADDDIRVPSDFVENHLKVIQTYQVEATNGLDIQADHPSQNLEDLSKKLQQLGDNRLLVGCSSMFSNANSCVSQKMIQSLIGNDINFDGGYGEDSDVGLRILQHGGIVLHNPFSPNLHLKPPSGGYRDWGLQANILGKKRKKQPWELEHPVTYVKPIPSPTITYGIIKHYSKDQVDEWMHKYFYLYLFKGKKSTLLFRIVRLPLRIYQFKKSLFYATKLKARGPLYE